MGVYEGRREYERGWGCMREEGSMRGGGGV